MTQVLNDGTNNYIYGNDRIAQVNTGTEYFLGDALGSVRQLTNSNGAVTYAGAYDPYGVTTQTHGASQSAYGYTGEYTSNDMVYLRARYYNPGMGRFLTRDTWEGNANSPMSFNRWNYVNGNPANYTDPTGNRFVFGVDTVACLIALAIGVPIIAGVSLSAYNYYGEQGYGYGGINWNSQACADWYQVLTAGKDGSLGALSSEGKLIASIPLTPVYIAASLVYHETPAEVNENILSEFGLDDEYRAAERNPYFYAGQKGGDVAMTYISLATFFKGLPSFRLTSTSVSVPSLQSGGLFANRLILTLPGVEAIGGSGELIYVGTAGLVPQVSMMSGGGGSSESSGKPRPTYEEYHKEYEYAVQRTKHSLMLIKRYGLEIEKANNSQVVQSMMSEIEQSQTDATFWYQLATKIRFQAMDNGFNTSSWSALPPLSWLQ